LFCIVFLVMLGLVSSVINQEFGWEEHLQNDLFYVEWDVLKSINVFSVHAAEANNSGDWWSENPISQSSGFR